MEFKNKIILIVGASSGIGRSVAIKLASEGAKLVVTARRKDKLDALTAEIVAFGGECLSLPADAQDELAAENVVASAVAHYGRIDMVMLNAGGAPAIDMRTMNASQVKHYMQTNYDTMVNYLFPVLEQMKKQKSGLVVHTNSLAGFIGFPLQGPYCAAKAAGRLLMDTCRLEFAEYGIKFCSVYPGFVATEVTKNDGMPAPLEISEEKCADYILYALRKELNDYAFPLNMRLILNIALALPKTFVNRILQKEVPQLQNM